MTTACLSNRVFLPAMLTVFVAMGLSGCHSIDFYDPTLNQPVVPSSLEPPREKSLMSLPSYRIAPPDVLTIEMLKLVPLPPYRAEVYDVLQVDVIGTFPDQPISNAFLMVESEGIINLGPTYGAVRVVGMTIEEINAAVDEHLRQVLRQPEVSIQLARAAGTQEITGQYLVGLDGTVNLRRYGSVSIAGMTVAEARASIENHLAQYFDSPEVAVDVTAYNSKFYYVITEGANLGDNITRLPITGKETVLYALSQIGGRSQLSSKEIWIARPAPARTGCVQHLPVDYDAMLRGGSASTNYQILPGDRLYIAENELTALTNIVTKLTRPFEEAASATTLGGSTIRSMQTLGRSFNKRNR
ncbi:MAG: polysaccharide biosynthesis/export family protein [Thermoguttaceae bacterium]